MKVAVVGASGYSGGELLRLIAGHPLFEFTSAIAHSQAGEVITSVHPQLSGIYSGEFKKFHIDEIANVDLVFFALPHGESGKIIAEHSDIFSKKKIVDLGADFRLSASTQWEKYYGGKHHGVWQYGLPELPGMRAAIAHSSHVANPGCYATAIALALAPFSQVKERVNFRDVVVTAASGTTGAGRSAKINLIGSEVMNSISAYKVGGVHQHTPEIEESIGKVIQGNIKISFTPFLAPLPRGILASVSIPFSDGSTAEAREIFMSSYQKEPFVHVLTSGSWPQTSSLIGSNGAHVQVAFDEHAGRAVVISAIDNLGKGAAGQAIQNANLICGIDEVTGLTSVGVR